MLGNWIVMTSATTGTGNLTLSSVSGYPTIANEFADSVRFQYALLDDSTGAPRECGIGYVTTGTTLVRELVVATYVSGTYSSYPAAASMSGTTRVIVTPMASGIGPSLPQIHSSATRYYFMANYQIAVNPRSLSANVLYMIAGPVAVTAKVTGMVCDITTGAGTGSNKLRMGIYSVKPDGTPGAVIAETANALPNSVAVVAPSFSSPISLPAGYYYFGVISDVAPTIRGNSGGSVRGYMTSPLGSNSFSNMNAYATDNNGGSTFSGWTTMPSYVGFSFTAFTVDYPPAIGLVLA